MEEKFIKFGKNLVPADEFVAPGHSFCIGCGEALALRLACKALGKNIIIANVTGCIEISTSPLPYTSWKVPWIHTLFENAGAVISGVEAGLKILMKKGKMPERDIKCVAMAGDGGTSDIGLQALSGAFERNHNFLYLCFDNEAYMNTGIQRSGSTPIGAWTTTTPVGKTGEWEKSPKKNMVAILAAHRIPYAATACIAYPEDLIKKIKKAKEIKGFRFIQIYAPCPTGWKSDPSRTIEIARLAVRTKIFPLYKVENGVYKISMKPKEVPIEDYLRLQGRFRHLSEDMVEYMKKEIQKEWENLLKMEQFTREIYGTEE